MKKIVILSLILASCATPKPRSKPDPVHRYKSVQERIMDCYAFLKRMGASDKTASEFCPMIYKEGE